MQFSSMARTRLRKARNPQQCRCRLQRAYPPAYRVPAPILKRSLMVQPQQAIALRRQSLRASGSQGRVSVLIVVYRIATNLIIGIVDALITSVNVRSHSGLQVEKHISLDIPASPTRTQHSVTISVPFSHYFLQITPTVSSSLLHRPSKTMVTCSNPSPQRLQQVPQKEGDPRRPLYETRVTPGVNVIDVEVIAGPPRGAPKIGSGQEIDFEKITIFVHLQRS